MGTCITGRMLQQYDPHNDYYSTEHGDMLRPFALRNHPLLTREMKRRTWMGAIKYGDRKHLTKTQHHNRQRNHF